MWCDHPFSQRNKATKRALRLKVGGKDGGRTKFEKGGGACVDNIGGVFKK